MRLGISTSLRHENPVDWAEKMAALGCKSVVFPVDDTAPTEVLDAYARSAKEHDLVIAEVGAWCNNPLAKDAKEAQLAMDRIISQVRLADRVGAKCCVNISGSMGEVWDGPYRENFSKTAWDGTVRMVQEVIDEAKPVNTSFTLEPMPWMYPSSPEEYVNLLEAVNREAFKVHLDPINMISSPDRYFFMEDFLERCFRLLGKDIVSCHLKDVHLNPKFTFQLIECDCGEGEFPLERYVQLVNETDAQIPVLIEHLHTDEEYIRSLKYVQNRLGL